MILARIRATHPALRQARSKVRIAAADGMQTRTHTKASDTPQTSAFDLLCPRVWWSEGVDGD